MSEMTILDAFADPALFGSLFKEKTWERHKTLLAGLFGLPMTAEMEEIHQHHTGRTTLLNAVSKKALLLTGRRTAKSLMEAVIAIYLAVIPDYSTRLMPGETPTILIVAPDKKGARAIFRYVRGIMNRIDILRPMIESEKDESLMLTNGVCIEVLAANYRTLRGYTLVGCLLDEAAFFRDESGANPDQEIVNAIEPALGTLQGMLIVASTPYAQRGLVYNVFKSNYGRDDADWYVWRGTTAEMNPTYPAHLIAAAYEADPQRASAEYGAQFRNDIAAFVSREVVESCVVSGRYELPRIGGVKYHAFADPSGGSSDSMTLAITHRQGDMTILDAVRERKAPFNPHQVVGEFAAALRDYGITQVSGDRYASGWPPERFREHGITYEPSESAKSELYQNVLPMLNSGKAELLDLKPLVAQFCSLERRTARGGRDSIDHPPHQHDDLANAVAGALLLAGKPRAAPVRTARINVFGR